MSKWADFFTNSGDVEQTYVKYSTRPVSEVVEISTALDANYPHFLLTLTPERNYMHYVLSEMICNVSTPSQEYLGIESKRIYDDTVHLVMEAYDREKEQIEIGKKSISDAAEQYIQNKRTYNSAAVNLDEEWLRYFEETYNAIHQNIYKSGYVPGLIDKKLDTIKKVFCAVCEDEFERRQSEGIAKRIAQDVIQSEIKEGKLNPLSLHDKDDRLNIAMMGVIGAGKSYFLNSMINEGKIRREDYAFIDIDEFKELPLMRAENDLEGQSTTILGGHVHNECHMIRRKVITALEDKVKSGLAPNAIIVTSQLSRRVLDWLTADNTKTNIYLFTCEAEQALKNVVDRQAATGRVTDPELVMKSIRNMFVSVTYLLFKVIGDNNIFLQIEDTSKARTEGSRTVLKYEPNSGLHVYGIDSLLACQEDLLPNRTLNQERVKAILRPHHVTFYSKAGDPIAKKNNDTGVINSSGGIIPKELQSINDHSTPSISM